jgi:hypothetical protein
MTHEEKINYMRIAAGITGFGLRDEHLDLLVSLYELVVKREGKTSLSDVVDIEREVKKRADIKARQDALDKVSEKVGECGKNVANDDF